MGRRALASAAVGLLQGAEPVAAADGGGETCFRSHCLEGRAPQLSLVVRPRVAPLAMARRTADHMARGLLNSMSGRPPSMALRRAIDGNTLEPFVLRMSPIGARIR
jgi:hypothetical protein